MTDWADDTESDALPTTGVPVVVPEPDKALPPSETIEKGDQLIKVSYKWRTNEGTSKRELIKVTRTFQLEHQKTSKKVAMRKKWDKFGLSKPDPQGPQDSTTMFAEEVTMRFIHADQTEEDAEEEDEQMTKIKRQFEYFSFFQGFNRSDDKSNTMRPPNSMMPIESNATLRQLTEKYVPPNRGSRTGPGVRPGYGDEVPAIRVSNISSAATQEDLQQLFEKFGRISRIHLGRDRRTNESRGFAFINYAGRDDAQKAIDTMNGYGYDHLILSVEWSENRKKEGEPGAEGGKPTGFQSRIRRN